MSIIDSTTNIRIVRKEIYDYIYLTLQITDEKQLTFSNNHLDLGLPILSYNFFRHC